jgi:hypothetical protein
LADFDRLAAVQRIVAVDRERIVEKDVSRAVLVPTKDSESLRSELALSLLVEKLILEIKRIKKENNNVNLRLDEEVGLIFFTELYDKQAVAVGADFTSSLKQYTAAAISKLGSSGNWTNDHELIINTILQERFAMANLVRQANLEIEKVRAVSDKQAAAYRERENQFLLTSKTLSETQTTLNDLIANNPTLQDNVVLIRLTQNLTSFSASSGWKLDEPLRLLGDFVGSGNDFNRVSSLLREREAESYLLKGRLFDFERASLKTEYSGVDSDRTLQTLRAENANLVREVDRLKSSASTTSNSNNREKELEMKLKTANSRIQELESQLRTAELQLRQLKDTKSSAATSVVGENPSGSNLVSSQYSSVSSSSQPFANKPYETPSYGVNSGYSVESSQSSSGVRTNSYVQPPTNFGTTYGQAGTLAYQASNKLTASGATSVPAQPTTYGTTTTSNYSANYTPAQSATTPSYAGNSGSSGSAGSYNTPTANTLNYGSSGVTGTANYGSSGATGTANYGSSGSGSSYTSGATGTGYGTAGLTAATTYGTSGTAGTTYGTSGSTSATNYGTSGATSGSTYGVSGATSGSTYGVSGTSGSYSSGATGTFGIAGSSTASPSSSLTSSGVKLSSSNAYSSGTSGLSGYTFQTKKY